MREHLLRIDGTALAGFGRDVPERFDLMLGEKAISCRDALRVLPGRRVVVRADVDGMPALAKIFLGPTAARDRAREERGVALLRAAGVPTPEGLGGCSAVDAEVVLYRYLTDARPLSAEQLPAAVGRLAQMHDAGLVHDDLHRGNLLDDRDTLHVVDGGAVRSLGATVTIAARTDQLATLLAQFGVDAYDHVARALDSYRGVSANAAIEHRALTRALAVALARRVDRAVAKCTRECSAFRIEHRFDRFVACRRSHWREMSVLIEDPDSAMARGTALKNGRSATVVRLALGGIDVVIKRYNIKSRLHAVSRAFRKTRAERAWRSAERLAKLGIATAEPLALIERRCGPLRGRAYLVSRALEGESLAALEHPRAHLDVLVGLLARLRRAGLVHGDAKAKNFVRAGDAVAVIDLDSLRAPRSRNAIRRGQDEDVRRLAANWPECTELESTIRARLAALEARAT